MTIASETLRSIAAPDRLETRLGALEFVDGVPTGEAVEKAYDDLDFVHGLNAYLDGFAGPSTYAIRKGFHDVGVDDNAVLIFSELMGSESVFLTANGDTVYFLGFVDLTSGPMVVETPPQALGVFDDMWWGGSSTSGCRARIAARAASSCSSRRATTACCRTAATTSGVRARQGRSCSGARSWWTTTRPRPSRRSRAR